MDTVYTYERDIAFLLVLLIRQARDSYPANKFIRQVKKQKKLLLSNQDRVLKKVEEAKNNKAEKVNDAVLEWLNEFQQLVQEQKHLETKLKLDKINCFGFRSRPLKKRYQLYYQIQDKVEKLNATCQFDQFSIPIPGIEKFSNENIMRFKSTIDAADQMLEALENDSVFIIGLYGTRGTGKTQLVKAVGRKALFLEIFDEVIFVNVHQNPNVKMIQKEIGEGLGLRLEESSESVRARRISSRLESMELRVLVILDDVREKLELDNIGIPCKNKQCKVVLTTRLEQVCTLMDCEWQIPLLPMTEEEAWMWFKEYSGLQEKQGWNQSSSELISVASEIVKECKWLPSTIKEVGSSLNGKPIEEWKAVLGALRHSNAQYQIFLSFRGVDTRYSFTSYLYQALCEHGFKTFMDETGLEGGDQISLTLIEAIEKSRLSIIVFSENYAYSTWCLEELVTILECMRTKSQLVWPIFYKVDPSDVRRQRNSYGRAMEVHENRFGNGSERVQRWRLALSQVANLSGEHFITGHEYQFIQRIVEKANNNRHRLYIQSMD